MHYNNNNITLILLGLRVLDFDRNCVRADSTVLKFYSQMDRILGLSHADTNRKNTADIEEVDHWWWGGGGISLGNY